MYVKQPIKDTRKPIAAYVRYTAAKPVNLGRFGVVSDGDVLPLNAREAKSIAGDERFQRVELVERPQDLPPINEEQQPEPTPEPAPQNKRQRVQSTK